MDPYVRAFAAFNAATDEKEVLAAALTDQIRRADARSICDIGAGAGDLAQRLADIVDTYVAVEFRPDHVEKLRRLGLRVVERRWPTPIHGRFDAVVMSHVLNWRSTVNGMLRGAVDVLSPEGVLLIILHAIDGSEWERLLRVMMMPRALQPDLTLTVKRWLSSRGFSVRQRRITTVVRAETDVCLIEALSFVAGENDEGTANTFALRLAESNLVSQQYRTDDGEYVFEFGHLLLCAMRAGERG